MFSKASQPTEIRRTEFAHLSSYSSCHHSRTGGVHPGLEFGTSHHRTAIAGLERAFPGARTHLRRRITLRHIVVCAVLLPSYLVSDYSRGSGRKNRPLLRSRRLRREPDAPGAQG